ncbi:MAG TPA: HlyD family efflux transporter periplasmic adaptor subunit [Anaerolineaceae bacterium]|nr:HlyD family efflux transporter periplasmic adaptor subunit [Anaerolineaceae bacterium]HPN52850.1 HlyD family efflux transporter periplasmic adaptor subunit [Anaerolineaceae bacterium]
MKKLVLTLLVISALLTACGGPATPTPTAQPTVETNVLPNVVTAEGKLLPDPRMDLAFVQSGLVAEVLVKPGEKVAAGDLLARLTGIETVQAEWSAAELDRTLTQQSIDKLKRSALLNATQTQKARLDAQTAYDNEVKGWRIVDDDTATDLDLAIDDYVEAEKDVRDAREKLDGLLDKDETDRERVDAQDDLDREESLRSDAYADLQKEAIENDQPLTSQQMRMLTVIAALEMTRADVDRLENNLDPETLAALEARLAAAEAHAAAAKASLAFYELRAPFSGTLLRFDLKTGEPVMAGVPVAYVAGDNRWVVETTDLAEIDIARVALGDNVSIKLDAFSGETFTGKVSAIDPVGREYLGDMTYKVTITLDAPDERFYWNMTATINIEVK